jgi:hypothetical protein
MLLNTRNAANRVVVNQHIRDYRRSVSGWVSTTLSGCKRRAKQRAVPFDLAPEDLLPLPEFCPVFGVRLVYGGIHGNRNRASLDCKVPKRGYVKGNIAIISVRANLIKQDCTHGDELRKVADWVDNNVFF